MKTFVIKYVENQISISEYEDNELDAMRYKGENSWEFEKSSFWSWFKEKTEYADEKLSFIIFYDVELSIDDTITISDKHHLASDDILDLVYEYSDDLMVKTLPYQELKMKQKKKTKEKLVTSPKKPKTLQNREITLQKYFKNKTDSHKG